MCFGGIPYALAAAAPSAYYERALSARPQSSPLGAYRVNIINLSAKSMDRTTVITLIVNSIATILTTIVVTRISLGKRIFLVPSAAKSFIRDHGFTIFALLMVALNGYVVIDFLSEVGPPTRLQVATIPINVFNILLYPLAFVAVIAKKRKNASKQTDFNRSA